MILLLSQGVNQNLIPNMKVSNWENQLSNYKLAVDNASDHIVITNPQGICLYANAAVESITGYKQAEVVGKKAGSKELWGGLMSADFYKKMWHTLTIQKKAFKGRIRNRKKNGVIYTAESSITPVLDEKTNEIRFFIGIERDISKEVDLEEAKTQFLSLASHQLRTPLSTVNWYSETLLEGELGKLSAKQLAYVKEISVAGKRMSDLVNSLLNVTRIELGTMATSIAKVNLKDMIAEILDDLVIIIKTQEIKIKVNYYGYSSFITDSNQMLLIFHNLISNAVKYSKKGGTVHVDFKISKAPKRVLVATVADDGYGIPHQQQSQIFVKLFRAENVIKRDTDGTGLGLYLVKKIADQLRAKLSFVSQENVGTTFTIKIPETQIHNKK